MWKYLLLSIISILIIAQFGLLDVGGLLEKRTIGIHADKSEYKSGQAIIINATGSGRKYVSIGQFPFEFFKFGEKSKAWEKLDVGNGPLPKIYCNNGRMELSGTAVDDRLVCRQLESMQFKWMGNSWRTVRIPCGQSELDETRIVNETGRIKAQLTVYDDSSCTKLNATLSVEFQINPRT
ncbi:MAG: hypothetical protein AABX01_02360 [Candidatus Micrarchaeota archaeon]